MQLITGGGGVCCPVLRFSLVPTTTHAPASTNSRASSRYQETAVRSLLNPDRYEHDALRCAAWAPSTRVRCSVRTPRMEEVCAALSGPVLAAMSSLFGVVVRVRKADCLRSQPRADHVHTATQERK